MLDSEYKLVSDVQAEHWWWLGREKLLRSKMKKHLQRSRGFLFADVGCGFGANIPLLRAFGDVVGLELNAGARQKVKQQWGSAVPTISWKSPNKVKRLFNAALLADVLEHIPDDADAVEWLHQHIKPDGLVFITVPAHQFLWTQMDDVLFHHRRYTKESLVALFDKKFEVLECHYYNLFLFPVKLLFVLFDRLSTRFFPSKEKQSYNNIPPLGLNWIFKFILKAEVEIFEKVHQPFGISLVLVAKRISP